MSEAVNVPDASPKRMLVAWANEQDGWVRRAVSEIMASNKPLGESALVALQDHYAAEKGLTTETPNPVPVIELLEDEAAAEDLLELRRLSGVKGVNALAADQAIDFDPGLTVLFGQNGAGKTGYSRILKRLAAVRTAEEILPNAHGTGAPEPPSATIEYSLNGQPDTLHWTNGAGVAPFTRMSVFDAPAVNLHVDSELNYVFTPSELALFTHVSAAVQHVQTWLDAEARRLRPTSNPFIAHFRRETRVYPLVEALGATTEIAELRELADDSHEGEDRAQVLTEEVAALKGGNVEARLAIVRQESERLAVFIRVARAATTFEPAGYSANLLALRRLEADHRSARQQLFRPDELPTAPDDEWARFVIEAEHYLDHIGKEHYPAEGDSCIYCGQKLNVEARELIAKYRTFLDDVLARQVTAANEAFAASQLRLPEASLEVARNNLDQTLEQQPKPPYADEVARFLTSLEAVKSSSDDGTPLPSGDIKASATALLTAMEQTSGAVASTLADLEKQKAERVEVLIAKERELAELIAQRSLARHMAAIELHVAAAKRSSRMYSLAKAMSNSLLRPLTNLSKLASEDLANKSFERMFVEECQALRAPAVALEFQGRRGQAERKKAVATYRPSAVLSEGEQKVLAVADFLAESRMSGVKAPIIFDDPVTSLDYLRLNEVAERISRLAEAHQVIVFTHNIFFASTLLALRNNKKLKCKFYEVRDQDASKGVVMADVEPRQDTPADIGKKINELIQSAGNADSVLQEALVERGYGLLRSWCEAFVEQEVLQNVSQRFRVNVMMGGLNKINLERFEATVGHVIPMFDRCSRFMPGHSQPVEQLNVRPSLADFKTDWEAMQETRKAHIAK